MQFILVILHGGENKGIPTKRNHSGVILTKKLTLSVARLRFKRELNLRGFFFISTARAFEHVLDDAVHPDLHHHHEGELVHQGNKVKAGRKKVARGKVARGKVARGKAGSGKVARGKAGLGKAGHGKVEQEKVASKKKGLKGIMLKIMKKQAGGRKELNQQLGRHELKKRRQAERKRLAGKHGKQGKQAGLTLAKKAHSGRSKASKKKADNHNNIRGGLRVARVPKHEILTTLKPYNMTMSNTTKTNSTKHMG